MLDQRSDKDLIQEVLNGTRQAYAILVSRYQSFVFTLVLRQIPVREEAEEVAQDVFVKAYSHLGDFRGACKFSTWLYQITYTTCISHHRKRKERTVAMEEDYMVAIADGNNQHEPVGQYAERKSERKLLTEAIGKLPDNDAQLITLFYQHEQSLEEIAIITGMTANNVKVKLFRARQKLKDVLEHSYATELS